MFRLSMLTACIIFVFYLLWLDEKKENGFSKALWLPLIWMFFAGTRELSEWLGLRVGYSQGSVESSLIDPVLQFTLILFGITILSRRTVYWGQLLSNNRWIWLFFLFGAISIIWSDYPFVSLKRWAKSTGNVVMALVILTEERPYEAFGDVLRRLAILTIPLSIPLCKYYPEIGRFMHRDSWQFSGMAAGKNLLGQLCLLSGMYFCSNLLIRGHDTIKVGGYPPKMLSYLFLGMTAWLMYMANSATSTICLVVALSLYLGSRISWIATKPRRILTVSLIVVGLGWLLQETFDIFGLVLAALGREADLTSRLPMWQDLLNMQTNPFLGFGYESFWLGDRLNYLWEKYAGFLQSHNGYLQIYLDLGFVGLFIWVGSIVSGLVKVGKHLTVDYPMAIIRLSIIIVVALYNWTEATFYGVSNMWLLLFVGIIDMSGQPYWARADDNN